MYLDGSKTYLLAVLAVVYGLAGWILNYLSPLEAQQIVWGGLTAAALRRGVSNGK